MIDAINEFFSEIEAKIIAINELDISSKVNAIIGPNKEQASEVIAEGIAFLFSEDNKENNGWGTYFGPVATLPNEDGTATEIPSIKKIDGAIIKHWEKRSHETKHPVLKARYSGLVWDFSQQVTSKQASHEFAKIYVSSLLDIAEADLHTSKTSIIHKLERAQSVALSLNADELIQRANQVIMDYEDRVADDTKAGLFGFSFDLLVENKNSKATDGQIDKITSDLESRLERIAETGNPWACEKVAKRLADYYRRKGEKEDVHRVVKVLGASFERVSKSAEPLQKSFWLDHMHHIYASFHMKDEANAILKQLREVGPSVIDEMKEISASVEIPKEKFESIIESALSDNLDEAIERIAVSYIPPKDKIKTQLIEQATAHPLSYFIPKTIQDAQGRPIAQIGSLDDDLDGNIVHHLTQNMSIDSVFLAEVLKRLIERHALDVAKLTELIYRSPVFLEEKKTTISRGIKCYLEKDYLVSAHLLIPQIEDGIRRLIELLNGNILKRGRLGGFQYKVLGELLRDETFVGYFGEDIPFYFQVLYTDVRGWNLRNQIFHGLMTDKSIKDIHLDRVIHTLFILSLVKEK